MSKKKIPNHQPLAPQSDPVSDDDAALLGVIHQALLEKKAEDIIQLDVRPLTTLTDFFIVCHASTDVQIKAIADNVMVKTKYELGEPVWNKEGLDTRRWVILDYVNVVVHIFKKELREFYNLEKMWNDAVSISIADI